MSQIIDSTVTEVGLGQKEKGEEVLGLVLESLSL
jgi:hypothetical protein